MAASTAPAAPKLSLRDTYWPLLLLLPLALIALLRGAPHIDERWENHAAHFWIVLVDGGRLPRRSRSRSARAARRRRDARLLLIGLAFVVSAGFLGLHALATPGVRRRGKNAGFVLATPVGLVLAGRARRGLGDRVQARDLALDRPARARCCSGSCSR